MKLETRDYDIKYVLEGQSISSMRPGSVVWVGAYVGAPGSVVSCVAVRQRWVKARLSWANPVTVCEHAGVTGLTLGCDLRCCGELGRMLVHWFVRLS